MGAKQKLLTVASNGQISIGKEWAGKHIVIETVSDSVLVIKSGSFTPDNQKVFFTPEAQKSLNEFNDWEGKNTSQKTDSSKVLDKIKARREVHRQARAKK